MKGLITTGFLVLVSLIMISHSGAAQWARTYGGPDNDYATAILQTADGGYMSGRLYLFLWSNKW